MSMEPWETNFIRQSRNTLHFMEPQGSLYPSQELITHPKTESGEFILCPHIFFF